MDDRVLAGVRQELIALLRKGRRLVGADRESKWHPQTVRNPATDDWFSDPSAWELILDTLQQGDVSLAHVELTKFAGGSAYSLKIPLEAGKPDLYIKLQLNRGWVVGRSFHYSVYDK